MTSEFLNSQPFPGLSWFFVLLFFAPLLFASLVATIAVRTQLRRARKVLLMLWGVACIPAASVIFMGYTVQPRGWNPLLQVAVWFGAGALIVWLPLKIKEALSDRPDADRNL
jgi:ABC-type uncharacterized transport system permease subunit